MAAKLFRFRHTAFLLLVSGILLLTGLDKIDVNIMEARNFISAREMVQNKEYLLTTINNEPRYQKPPLPTWLTAITGSLSGFDSLFALRLPVVGITILLVLVFFSFSKLLNLDAYQSMNNGLILITSFYIFFSGRDNQWDMYANSLMMVSIYCITRICREDTKIIQNTLLAGLFLGFSILSKGPVAFYALLLPFIISYATIYPIPFRRKGIYLLALVLLGLTIGLSWYVYVRLKDPQSFKLIAERETTNWINYEVKPFYYYWSFFLQSGLWSIASFTAIIYPYLKNRVSDLKAYRFALLWTFLALVFLSVIPEKKIRYLIPVLIPLALTTGFYIDYLFRNFNKSMGKGETLGIYLSFGLFAFIALIYPFVLVYFLKSHLTAHLLLFTVTSLLLYLCAYLILKGLLKRSFKKVFYAMISLFMLVVISLIPLYKEIIYNPDYSPAKKALTIGNQFGINSYALTSVAPEIVWDFGKSIPYLKKKDNVLTLPEEKKFGLMVDSKDSVTLRSLFPGYNIEKVCRINLYYKNKKKERLIKDYYILSKVPL